MVSLNKILKEVFELSEKEATTYIKLLELGKATTQRLSEVTSISRITLYDILNRLISKGLSGYTIINKVKHFYVVSPKDLLKIVNEKEEKIKSVMDILKARENIVGKKPKVVIFEGRENIDLINDDVLLNAKQILVYGTSKILTRLKYKAISFIKKRLTKKIMWKGVTDSGVIGNIPFKDKSYWKYTNLRINESLKNMSTWNYIYSNKVGIISLHGDNITGIIIEDKNVYETHKVLFDMLWKGSKGLKQNNK